MEENYTDDWTHVNDVDEIGDGRYLASPRNFDQAIVVNRSTDEIEMKLGEDGETDILDEQHNPDYLESENGTPAMLVGDSANDRIVEYANPDGVSGSDATGASSDSSEGDLTDGTGWERTWTLEGDLNWPRDADRLPSGNTLVTDSSNHRVVEVTPEGEIVWEVYAPWLVYDAARVPAGEHGGPTATDLNATGTYEVSASAGLHENRTALEACAATLGNVSGWAEGEQPTTEDETAEGAMGGDSGTDENGADGGEAGGDGENDEATAESPGVPGFGPLAALAGLLVALAVVGRRSR
jgi:PGF-CTERM protein